MSDHKQTRLSLGQKRKIMALLGFFAYIAVNQGSKKTPVSTVIINNRKQKTNKNSVGKSSTLLSNMILATTCD